MSELVNPRKGTTVTLRFMGPDGRPISGFGSSLAIEPWERRAKRVATEKKKRERIYRVFLVVRAIIICYVKKSILNTD